MFCSEYFSIGFSVLNQFVENPARIWLWYFSGESGSSEKENSKNIEPENEAFVSGISLLFIREFEFEFELNSSLHTISIFFKESISISFF